jgi:hypothetical protein
MAGGGVDAGGKGRQRVFDRRPTSSSPARETRAVAEQRHGRRPAASFTRTAIAIGQAACRPSSARHRPGGSIPTTAVARTSANHRAATARAVERASAGHAPAEAAPPRSPACDARVIPGTKAANAIAPAARRRRNRRREDQTPLPARRDPPPSAVPQQGTATAEPPVVKHHLRVVMMPPTVRPPIRRHSVERLARCVPSDTHRGRRHVRRRRSSPRAP